MGTRSWLWLLKWPIAALVLVSLLAGAYTINDWMQRERAAEALDIAPQRSSNSIVKLGAELADSHGIKDEPAQPTIWYPQVTVYGRVVPNPQATVEIRSPFAGTLHADPEHAWPALGRELKHGQVFGRIDIRSSPQDRLDIQAKLAEARVKEAGADSILKVRQEQLDRLVKLGVESLVRRDLDDAKVLVFEARTQVAAAKAAVELWQKALDVLERRGDQPASPWTEPLVAVADGEVTELAARPGATIEVGGLVARVVDFRRPLVRLELPPEAMAVGPPPSHVDLFAVRSAAEPLGSSKPPEVFAPDVPATLVGPAGHVDPGSQVAGYWYEVSQVKKNNGHDAGSTEAQWRPGLFVQARVQSSAAKPQEAVSVSGTALLFHLGRTLVYVRIGPGRFERREVRVLGRDGDRWVLAAGVAAGEPVVYRQAQVLLSEEFKPQGDLDND